MTNWKTLEDLTLTQSEQLQSLFEEAEAIVVGIGAGMSASTGFVYSGPRFTDVFPDFIKKYNFYDMLQAFVYEDWKSPEEMWAFKSRFTKLNYFDQGEGKAYTDLKAILDNKTHHIITTNADSAFYRSDYDMQKVFRCQGEYGLMQCRDQCHEQAYPINETWNQEMIDEQENMAVPSHLVPRCPKCGTYMEINKRNAIRDMVEDPDFKRQEKRYHEFLEQHQEGKVLYLEIGVGKTTPQFIRNPFQNAVMDNDEALYVTMNRKPYRINPEVRPQTVRITEDIETLFDTIRKEI